MNVGQNLELIQFLVDGVSSESPGFIVLRGYWQLDKHKSVSQYNPCDIFIVFTSTVHSLTLNYRLNSNRLKRLLFLIYTT